MGSPARHVLFYDGGCGVCHASVAFAIQRDPAHALDYAPLRGETFTRLVPPAVAATLPDSVVLMTPSGDLLVRSRAVAALLRALGGPWRLMGTLLSWCPSRLADAAYDVVARHRARLAPRPSASCPMVPASLRERFLP